MGVSGIMGLTSVICNLTYSEAFLLQSLHQENTAFFIIHSNSSVQSNACLILQQVLVETTVAGNNRLKMRTKEKSLYLRKMLLKHLE